MAHTLTLAHSDYDGDVVIVQDHNEHTVTRWFTVYKDNVTIIIEGIPGNPHTFDQERRVYKVREWVRFDKCRATKME